MALKASAQGTLAKTPFPHLLLYIQSKQLTGTLAVWPEDPHEKQGKTQDRVLFREGGIVAVRPLEPADSALNAVVRLFRRRDAPYAFYDAQNLLGTGEGTLTERVDLYAALSAGLRDTLRNDAVDAVLGRLRARPVRIRADVPVDRLHLNSKERALIDLMRAGPATLDELIEGGELPPHDARRLLYLLALIHGIEASDGASLQPSSEPPPPSKARAHPAAQALSASPAAPFKPSLPADTAPVAAKVATEANPPPPAPPGLSPFDEQRWTELCALYNKLDNLNHFELLGIHLSASGQEISDAYFARVKRFHPDKLPSSFAPIVHCAQTVFDRLTESSEALSNEVERADYLRTVAAGGGTRASERMMRDVLDSAVEFQKAEVFLRKRDLPQAMLLLQSALQKNPNESDYLALHAWLLHLMHPTEPAPFDEMVRSLDKALQDNPRNERAHYYKGVILKRMKLERQALRHFREAIDINPHNVDAAREVRLAGMRRNSMPAEPSATGGKLFARLFGTKPRND